MAQPAKRIISLYGAFNEMLLALGAENLIAARTAADNDLPQLARLPSVGTHMRPNAELVVALKPDIVLQMAGRNEAMLQTENLRRLGINTLTFNIDSFHSLFNVMRKLGALAGREEQAEAIIGSWRRRLDGLPKRGKKPTVYYEAREPNLLAAGQKHMVNAIIEAAGGKNVVAIPKKLARFNEEALILANPEFCLIQKGPMSPTPRPIPERANLKNLACAKSGHNFIVPEKTFARPGPGSVEAAEKLAGILAVGAQ